MSAVIVRNASYESDALRGLDCECRPFLNSVRVDIGEPFGAIEIAEDAVRAAAFILPPGETG